MGLKDLDPTLQEKLLDRIRALFALGDKDRNNSDVEAETATKKAQELLQKYNLTMSEVLDTEDKISDGIVDESSKEMKKSSLSTWENALACIVAECCECKSYTTETRRGKSKSYDIRFVGTQWDVAIAKELFKYLHETLLRKSRINYKNNLPYQRSYLEGACARLNQRVEEQNELFRKQQIENQKFALMVVNKKDAIQLYMDRELNLQDPNNRRPQAPVNPAAFYRGMSDANQFDLGTKNRIDSTEKAPEEQLEREEKNKSAREKMVDAFRKVYGDDFDIDGED